MANDEHVAMLKTARPANARGELIRSRTVRSWRPSHSAVRPLRRSAYNRGCRWQAFMAPGQRGWKLHPEGGLIGLGTSPCPACGIGERRGGEQRPRIGVLASAAKLSGGGDLDDLSEIHHRTPRKKRRRSTVHGNRVPQNEIALWSRSPDPYGRSPPGCRLHRFHFIGMRS